MSIIFVWLYLEDIIKAQISRVVGSTLAFALGSLRWLRHERTKSQTRLRHSLSCRLVSLSVSRCLSFCVSLSVPQLQHLLVTCCVFSSYHHGFHSILLCLTQYFYLSTLVSPCLCLTISASLSVYVSPSATPVCLWVTVCALVCKNELLERLNAAATF